MTKIGRGHGIPAKVNSFDPGMLPGSFLYKKEPAGYMWLYSLHACKQPLTRIMQVLTIVTQQKQIGCFNHRVVTLVADKLKRQWLCIVYFANCIRQPERRLPRPSTTLSCTYSNHQSCIFERGHTCMYIKEHTIISCRYSNLCERKSPQNHHIFL